MTKKILSVVGARPNFIKAKLISDQFKKHGIKEILLHTGQHYDYHLSQIFFEGLNLKKPDINLKIGTKEPSEQTAQMMIGIEKTLIQHKPKIVIVYGDTNSTLAGALAGAKRFIPIIHIEAGERSYDKKSPEEINRVICDHLSRINCCATKKALLHLRQENLAKTAHFTGDIMLDIFLQNVGMATSPMEKIPKKFILLTLHRAENTDDKNRLTKIIRSLKSIDFPVVWPIHPRSRKMLKIYKIKTPKNLLLIEPVSYKEILWLEKNSFRIITDSGGIQKEAYWLKVPCLTLLNKTGWSETLPGNWNQLVGENYNMIEALISKKIEGEPSKIQFGDGHAAEKTIKVIKTILSE